MTDDAIAIRTEPKPHCALCGQPGFLLYDDLHDRLFNAPGTWSLKQCSNRGCRLLWLDPAPHKDDVWKAYLNYYTHQDGLSSSPGAGRKVYRYVRDCYLALKYGYCQQFVESGLKWLGIVLYFFPGKRADVDFSVMYLTHKPGGRLLEIGCGSGLMLSHMGSLGWQTEGIDVDPTAIANARSKGLKVALGSLEEQMLESNTFDAIMLSHVIEHVADPAELLTECHRILKPGGVLSLVTPNTESLGRCLFGRSWLHHDPPRHLMLYNGKALHGLVQKAGFGDIAIRTTIREAHSLFWASHVIRTRGSFAMGTQPGTFVKPTVIVLRLMEWALLKILPGKGEEISLVGRKA